MTREAINQVQRSDRSLFMMTGFGIPPGLQTNKSNQIDNPIRFDLDTKISDLV
jgi:hypothetical protein